MKSIHFTILGVPKSLKNGKRIIRVGDRPRLISNKAYKEWEKSALEQVRRQWFVECNGRCSTITVPVAVVATVYQGAKQSIDLTNAFEGTQDVLEKVGVLANDYLIQGVKLCRDRDRERPRIELSIFPYDPDQW